MQVEILKWAELITKLLPEWNHSRANADIEKQEFLTAVKEIVFSEKNQAEQMRKFQQLILEKVPDSHIQIINKKNQPDNDKLSVENSNLIFQQKRLKQVSLFTVDARTKPWMIATEKVNNIPYGIVAIHSFGGEVNDKHRSAFVDCLMKEKNDKKWLAIIFDFRDNIGGDSSVIKEIAERLSGQIVQYADKTEIVSYQDKQISEEYKNILAHKDHTITMPDFSNKRRDTDRFSGPVYVLQNHLNASATEGAIYMLSQLPNCTTIGIPTKGAFQGGSTVVLPLNENYDLIIGTEYRERFYPNGVDKGKPILEKKGMAPNIYSTNAYFTALKLMTTYYSQKQKNNVQLLQQFKGEQIYG